MGLLARLGKSKKESQPETEPLEQPKVKSDLRLYLENIISLADSVDMDNVNIPGIPFSPKKILPLIAKKVSDEMLEKMADFIEIVANDIKKIREREPEQLNEVKQNSTELQQVGAV